FQVSKMGDLFTGRAATISGSLAVDTNTLFVDNVNNRVGIGTSTPSFALDVNGDAYVNGTLRVTSSYRIGDAQVITGSAGTLNLGSHGSWTTVNYGSGSTTSH